jgi:hypothetical protein
MSSRTLCGTLIENPLAAKSTLVRGAADFGWGAESAAYLGTPVVMMTQPRGHRLTRSGSQPIAKRTMAST